MFAAFYLPSFSLQALLRYRPDLKQQVVAVLDVNIWESNEPAKASGVQVGMTSTQALARCPDLHLLRRSVPTENTLSEILLELASTRSACVEQTTPNLCTLDLRRIRIADYQQWAVKATEQARAHHLQLQVGIADNPDLASLAAHTSETITVVRDTAEFISLLDVATIDPSPPVAAILRDWGVHNLGNLSRLSKDHLCQCFGTEGSLLWEKVHGTASRLLSLVRPREVFEETYDFEHEIQTTSPLLFILKRFLDQLCLRLLNQYCVAEKAILILQLVNGEIHRHVFTIPAPTSASQVLYHICETYLDQLVLEQSATGIRLILESTTPTSQQSPLFESSLRDPNRYWTTIAKLKGLIGDDKVGHMELQPTHEPDCFHFTARLNESVDRKASPLSPMRVGLPLRRFRPSLPATVTVHRGTPAHIRSAKVNAAIGDSLGPYRLSGHWWDEQAWSSEWWDITIADWGLFRIERHIAGAWFLEGCYDLFENQLSLL